MSDETRTPYTHASFKSPTIYIEVNGQGKYDWSVEVGAESTDPARNSADVTVTTYRGTAGTLTDARAAAKKAVGK